MDQCPLTPKGYASDCERSTSKGSSVTKEEGSDLRHTIVIQLPEALCFELQWSISHLHKVHLYWNILPLKSHCIVGCMHIKC